MMKKYKKKALKPLQVKRFKLFYLIIIFYSNSNGAAPHCTVCATKP